MQNKTHFIELLLLIKVIKLDEIEEILKSNTKKEHELDLSKLTEREKADVNLSYIL